MTTAVGILALQGDFEPHARAFATLGVETREVRSKKALDGLTHLVLPGGESTTLERLLVLFGLRDELVRRHRGGTLALFGTCAGAILLGRASDEPPRRLGLLDLEVRRNAYGPQIASHSRSLELEAFGRRFPCVFIRAPKFGELGSEVRVLARHGTDPVLVEGPGALAATFHPELTEDPFLHRYFLDAFAVPHPARVWRRPG